jgi:hypothetical protein
METNPKTDIAITTKKGAWDLIHKLAAAEIKAENINLHFENFPVLEIRYDGPQFSGSLPFRAIEALVKVQEDIDAAYKMAKYGIETGSLSQLEKDSLEIVVKVKEGSSIIELGLSEQAQQILLVAAGKMTPNDYIVMALIFGVAYASPKLVQHFQETRRKEIGSKTEIARSLEETARISDLARVIGQQSADQKSILDRVIDNSIRDITALAKVVNEGDTVQIGDFDTLGKEGVKEQFKYKRTKREKTILSTQFLVKGVSRKNDMVTVQAVLQLDGREFSAEIQEGTVDMLSELTEAFRQKLPIGLKIDCKLDKDLMIGDAMIVGFSD